jgi:NTP pyrophosphatase (non-canonical NTP hydrolase)
MQERSSKLIAERVADLARCVEAFHERFGLAGPSTQEELLSRIPIQEEEVRELQDALLHEGSERVASEATDVLFVAIGTMLRLDPSLVDAAIHEVMAKNDAKTEATHHINAAGKIVRRVGNDSLA